MKSIQSSESQQIQTFLKGDFHKEYPKLKP